MKQSAVFLSGLAATITGAFIRSCNSGFEMDLTHAWCGKPPPGAVLLGANAHCAGCAIAFAGLLAMGLAAANLLIGRNPKHAGIRVRP